MRVVYLSVLIGYYFECYEFFGFLVFEVFIVVRNMKEKNICYGY